MAIGVQAVFKETKNMIGWEILGDGVYEFVTVTNPVTGRREIVLMSTEEERAICPPISLSLRSDTGS